MDAHLNGFSLATESSYSFSLDLNELDRVDGERTLMV